MSYVPPAPSGFPAQAGGERTRPTTVTTAGVLLYVVAALVLVRVILDGSAMGQQVDAAREAYQGIAHNDVLVNTMQVALIGSMVFNVLVGVTFAIFAYHNIRGRNGVRIATWVVGGLGLLCFGCGAAGPSVMANVTMNSQQTPELTAAAAHVRDSVPSWYTSAVVGVDVLLFLCLALVIILLAVPASNQYFRRPEPPVAPYLAYPPMR